MIYDINRPHPRLAERDAEVMHFIRHWHRQFGTAPTIKQIANSRREWTFTMVRASLIRLQNADRLRKAITNPPTAQENSQ